MNERNSIVRRRGLRAYAAAFISYVMLVGQVAPLALAAAPKPAAPATPTATAPAPPARRAAAGAAAGLRAGHHGDQG